MATVIAQYKSQTELRAQNALAISTLEIESLGGGTYVPPGTENDWNENESRTAQALALMPRDSHGAIDWNQVRVGHLDTGATRHPSLGFGPAGSSPWIHLADGLNYMEQNEPPIDPLGYSGSLTQSGHGTRTLGALTASATTTLTGIAPTLPCVPYRVTNSVVLLADAQISAVAKAIRHAVETNCCSVITISLGSPLLYNPNRRVLQRAVDDAYDAGVIITCAGGQQFNKVVYPAKFSRTIAVGGLALLRNTTDDDSGDVQRNYRVYQDYPGWEDKIAVWAPAEPIQVPDTRLNGSGVDYIAGQWGDGTSFATPHVAATAAMWLALRRDDLLYKYPEPWQRVEAFRTLLHSTQREVPLRFPYQSAYLLDAHSLLTANLPAADTLTKAPNAVNEWL